MLILKSLHPVNAAAGGGVGAP